MPDKNIDPRRQNTFKEEPEITQDQPLNPDVNIHKPDVNPDISPDHPDRSPQGEPTEPMHEFDDEHPERNVPEEVLEEENDKPAGLAIHWSIVIAIVLLLLFYFIFIR